MKYIIRPCAKNDFNFAIYVKARNEDDLSNEDYYDDENNIIVLRPSIEKLPTSIKLGDDNGNTIGLFDPTDLEGTYKRKQ